MTREDPQYKLRIPEGLKARIEAASKSNNRSMNAEILSRLESSLAPDFDVSEQFGDIWIKGRWTVIVEPDVAEQLVRTPKTPNPRGFGISDSGSSNVIVDTQKNATTKAFLSISEFESLRLAVHETLDAEWSGETLSFTLPPDARAKLAEMAKAAGKSVDDYVHDVVMSGVRAATPDAKSAKKK